MASLKRRLAYQSLGQFDAGAVDAVCPHTLDRAVWPGGHDDWPFGQLELASDVFFLAEYGLLFQVRCSPLGL